MAPAASALASPTPPPQGSFGVRLYDVPVIDEHNPRGLRYIIDFLHPGTVIHRRILVLNSEPRTSRFTVFADAAKIIKGSFVGDAGKTRSELTTWIRVRHAALRIRPGQTTLDMITIRVPKVATRGEHYGVIWVQQSSRHRASDGSEVLEVSRVGVRIYLAIGRGGAPPTRFRITSVTGSTRPGGRPVVLAHVDNTGGRAIDLNGTAILSSGPGGAAVASVPEETVLTLAPGQSGNLVFAEHKGLPDGPWQAKVRLESGFTHGTLESAIDFSGRVGGSGLPWYLWVPGLLLGLAVVTIALMRYGPRPGRVVAPARRHAHS
jgi:hypothetical protein